MGCGPDKHVFVGNSLYEPIPVGGSPTAPTVSTRKSTAFTLSSNEQAETVTTASLPVEIPFIGRDRTERLLVLPKEEGEGIRAGDEQVRPALYGATLAQAADLLHRRLGEHPGVTAANNGLLAGVRWVQSVLAANADQDHVPACRLGDATARPESIHARDSGVRADPFPV